MIAPLSVCAVGAVLFTLLWAHSNSTEHSVWIVSNKKFQCKTFSPLFLPLLGKVLGNLQLNLLSKSKVYEDPALSAIFLHNNYNYILKSLEK